MSYPHLLFDRWESSFLWVVWSCRAARLPRFMRTARFFSAEMLHIKIVGVSSAAEPVLLRRHRLYSEQLLIGVVCFPSLRFNSDG